MSALAFTKEVIELYLREDLKEMENPLRQDHGVLLQDLRFLFRAYAYSVRGKEDWTPSPSARGPEDGSGER